MLGVILFLAANLLDFGALSKDELIGLQKLKPTQVGRLYHLLGTLDRLFEEEGIFYWLDGGTLLGAERHEAMVPWDYDADLKIFSGDVKKVYGLLEKLEGEGYQLIERIQDGVVHRLMVYCPHYRVHVDLFVNDVLDGSGKVHLSTSYYRKSYPTSHWYLWEIVPRQDMSFGPLTLKGPRDGMRYLKTHYGERVLTHAYVRFATKGYMKHFPRGKELELVGNTKPYYRCESAKFTIEGSENDAFYLGEKSSSERYRPHDLTRSNRVQAYRKVTRAED